MRCCILALLPAVPALWGFILHCHVLPIAGHKVYHIAETSLISLSASQLRVDNMAAADSTAEKRCVWCLISGKRMNALQTPLSATAHLQGRQQPLFQAVLNRPEVQSG
eukprot:GHRR01027025.1.p2 GENE.GHRR01027025.1~~GHRR01027025.1.p2  ORF type:complete len:108 (+),score=17.30 GHRR01027025.1:671-994(+)